VRHLTDQQVVVDGELVFRASYSAGRHFVTTKGVPSGGIFLFMKALRAIINHEPCGNVLVAWDTVPSWRHEVFPDYKGTRNYTPDPGRSEQRKIIKDILSLLDIQQLRAPKHEADDIASWVAGVSKLTTKFVTTDADWLQLVRGTDRTFFDFKSKKKIDIHNFAKETEYHDPTLVAPAKAILGDVGDNVPGADGIGIRTAMKYLKGEPVSPHARGLIEAWMKNPEGYERSLRLVDLTKYHREEMGGDTIDQVPEDTKKWDPKAVTDFFVDFEFNSLLKDFSFFDDFRIER